jgi:CheY-like chemotaxis protein
MARILLAEDEADLRGLVKRALSEAGHQVIETADGAEALERITRADAPFELVLTDIKMPVMDGIALALAIARDQPRLPILMMTGYADQRERAEGLDTLIAGVISKPFTLAEIRVAVEDALKRSGSARA